MGRARTCGHGKREVDFYTPMQSQTPAEGNPAKRSDPRQAVAEEDRPRLPRNDKKKLAKSCFVYDAESDRYYCPMGRPWITRRRTRTSVAG